MADQVTCLAVALGLKPVTDPEAMLRTVQRALRHREDWLLIFDNAETQDQVRPLLPGGVGHVLITTRRDGFRALGGVLDLDLMGRPDAITLLRRRCPTLTTTDADRLAERLGDLPLALDQAAAYLDHSGMAPEDYLTLLDTRGGELLARGEVGAYPHSVTTVWSLSLDRLQETTPAAVDLLGLCAWLAPEPIPLDLFTTHPELLPRHLAETTSDPLAFTDTVAALTDYALARRTTDGLILHRLVQDITRHRISDAGGWAPPLQTVLPLLRAALPDNVWYQPATWPVYRRLLPHVLTATRLAGDHPKDPGTTAWLLNQAGRYLRRMGQADNALPLHQRALAILEAMLGPDHPDVAWTLDCVGWALAVLGRNVEALHLQERALAIRETVHGPDHPDVATSLNRVGWVLTSLGRPAEALPHLQRALTIREAAFGPDHPNIAIDLNDLGRALTALGRPAEALHLQERALTIHETAFGPDHPNIATDLDYVGQALTALGRPAEALPLHQRALTIHETAFGPDHPNIATTLNDVGRALSALGRPAEARLYFERARAIGAAAKDHHGK